MDDSQDIIEDPDLFRVLVEGSLIIYIIVGTYGALWLSDDYDQIKTWLFAYFGIPLAVLYYSLPWFYPGWHRRQPRLFLTILVSLFLVFGTGHVLLINAATGASTTVKRDLSVDQKLMTYGVRRGGLGILYTTRW